MRQKSNKTDDRHMAIRPKTHPGDILLPFHRREIRFPMKQCPDCRKVGILALNGNLFGCPDCRHAFK